MKIFMLNVKIQDDNINNQKVEIYTIFFQDIDVDVLLVEDEHFYVLSRNLKKQNLEVF